MIFFGIPSVGQVRPETLFGSDDHYGFIQTLIGEEYNAKEVEEKCAVYYEKLKTGYWGRIITLVNFLGLKKLDENNKFNDIPILDFIAEDYDKGKTSSSKILFDYLLCQWQYPHPIVTRTTNINVIDSNVENPRLNLPIVKPYILFLSILKELYLQNPKSAFFTKQEFYWLGYIYYKRNGVGVNSDNALNLANEILEIRKVGWDYYESIKNEDKTSTHLSYPLGFLRNSSVLTTEQSDYSLGNEFFIGLKKTVSIIPILDSIILSSNDYFDFKRTKSVRDNKLSFDFSNYLYNKTTLNLWLSEVKLYNSTQDLFKLIDDKDDEFDLEKYKRKKAEIQLKRLSNLDKLTSSKRRTEQYILREYLLGKKDHGKCGLCNKDYPIKFLATAHIKKRSKCSNDEKKDINVVMPACHLGCDKIYEEGYIYVLQDGLIRSNLENKETTEPLKEYISDLEEKKCNYFKEETAHYFKYHAEQNI